MTGELNLQVAAIAGVPADLQGTAVVLIEEQFREGGGRVFHPDGQTFVEAVLALPSERADLLAGVRQYFIDTATAMRDAGVTTVVGTASWSSVRNLMRAAEIIGWYPTWMINDAQFALIVLTDAPAAQGANLVQISSKRAAGDPIDGLDRGCLSLRNTGTAAEPFSHRFHTDAWNLLTVTCDYLDMVFGAISRVDGPLTRNRSSPPCATPATSRPRHARDLQRRRLLRLGQLPGPGGRPHLRAERLGLHAAADRVVRAGWRHRRGQRNGGKR